MSDLTADNALNRATLRMFERKNPSCAKCGIKWLERNKQRSLCALSTGGHQFV